MNAEIITIGDEILIGQTVDTNSAWLGAELSKIGISVFRITSIHDQEDEIVRAVDEALGRSELVLVTGGLGPTQDDLTKKTLASYFGTQLVTNKAIRDEIQQRFEAMNRPALDVNLQQADLPESAEILRNSRGTAQGMWFERDGKVLISMPGVPYEMKGIMTDGGLERIQTFFHRDSILHKTVMTQGIGESFLASKISEWEDRVRGKGLGLAYLPSPGMVKLRLTAVGKEVSSLESQIDSFIDELYEIVPEHIYSRNGESLEDVIGKLLLERNETVSTAESCTGGYLAHLITSVPGSSGYYWGSVISYQDTVKVNELGVSQTTINEKGAVSEEVVCQMAEGVRNKLNTTYGIATSGVAGPDGGTDEKPVGTVWIAVASPQGTHAARFKFGRSRERNILQASLAGLSMLRQEILRVQLV